MAAIVNARDVLLQAANPRILPVTIPMDKVEGLEDALASAGKRIELTLSAASFAGASGTTTPIAITITATLHNNLQGAVTWSVVAGAATLSPNGTTCSVSGSSVSGASVTIRASVTDDGKTYSSQVTIGKYGALSAVDRVNLALQVTGQLASGNINGLGALALLNTVNLNTQTTGALNGATQVTNLGTLAYANAIAANQIGAGQLAAGVVYAGNVYATQIVAGSFVGKEFTGGTFTGSVFRTATSGDRIEINSAGSAANSLIVVDSGSRERLRISNIGAPIKVTGYQNLVAGIEVDARLGDGISISAQSGVGIIISDVVITHMYMAPKTVLVTTGTVSKGCITMHATHGLCIFDGTQWLKPAGGWAAV